MRMRRSGGKLAKPRTRTSKSDRDWSRMTPRELAQATEEFDKEFIADTFKPMTPAQRRRWRAANRPGPGPKSLSEKSVRLLITIHPRLLKQLDRAAKAAGLPRSQYIARAVHWNLRRAKAA